MAQQTIDLGTVADDGTGDTLRDGGDKINDNFTELYTAISGFVTSTSSKPPVRAASTANGTLASAFENGDTLDGVTLATGDRILLKNQSAGAENGIYIVNASGAPTRATDADSSAELVNASVWISEGTANADKFFVCTTNAPIVVNTTALTWINPFAGLGGGDLLSANNLSDLASAATARTNLSAAARSQAGEQISGFIASPSNKSYTIALDMKHAGTITEVTTKSASGTCTATWKINSTALGGTANSVSSSETTQSHASANVFAAGDDLVLTVSSNSSCADMSFTIRYTQTLA